MPSLDELRAQQAALTRALAEHELPLHEEASAILSAVASSTAMSRLAEIAANLPDSGAKNAIANVQNAINAAGAMIGIHLPQLRQLAGVAQTPMSPAQGNA